MAQTYAEYRTEISNTVNAELAARLGKDNMDHSDLSDILNEMPTPPDSPTRMAILETAPDEELERPALEYSEKGSSIRDTAFIALHDLIVSDLYSRAERFVAVDKLWELLKENALDFGDTDEIDDDLLDEWIEWARACPNLGSFQVPSWIRNLR